ncbi:hypothetical protein EJ02DRAFT_350543 [Clathrospora elynae]|uniref:Uncharacterized protein n=1 Tax=Clathrospora elynae TaxID=706981 RepID=A0A6A5SK45_9PLEO|nr:hypothetical protein EJ02DRAFT_350543 [Clathrospora elynae]
MGSYSLQSAAKERIERRVHGIDAVQGRVLWLPLKEELPHCAVKRAHGKGAVEDGIYGHPVVVISRPVDEKHAIHFHLITSLQGKKLYQLYNKSNEFHVSRRSWYLPISPTPDHPDATSKKTKKRFPTLELADGATLRWDSYVNIRHVYKINWSLLRVYANPETLITQHYGFERESLIRMLAKSKIFTMYEPASQHQNPVWNESTSEPIHVSTHITQKAKDNGKENILSVSDTASTTSPAYSGGPSAPQLGFRVPHVENYRIADLPLKVPPDTRVNPATTTSVRGMMLQPFEGRPSARSFDPNVMRRPVDQFGTDAKGVMAIIITSV